MNLVKLERAIEAILFTAGEAVELGKLAKAIEQDNNTTKRIICKLKDHYDMDDRGIQIIEVNDSFQMCTRKEYYKYIKTLYKAPKRHVLTEAQMETLAIIAYQQPITRSQIESIRGVRCDAVVNKLIDFNLICERGRLNAPGRPILFGTTDDFLRYFGLKDTEGLPEIEEELIDMLYKEVQQEIDENNESETK